MSDEPTDGGDEPGAILSPDELDFTEEDSVIEIDEGRFVISPRGTPIEPRTETNMRESERKASKTERMQSTGATNADSRSNADRFTDPEPASTRPASIDLEAAVTLRLASSTARYGFRIAAKFDDRVAHHTVVSNDIVTTFEQLLVWYARGVDDRTPIEDVLSILLSEANLPVAAPAANVRRLVSVHDLDTDDTIGDLLRVITESTKSDNEDGTRS